MNTHNTTAINLAFAFDENYVTPFYVVLTSVFVNHPGTAFCIHAIAPDVPVHVRKQISSYVQRHNSTISFYEVNKEALTGLVIPENTLFTIAAYYRLFFPALLPAWVEKYIYIDTDTVVVGNLSPLYNISMGNYAIGAAREVLRKSRTDLGITDINNYFNSGVLLVNKAEWLKQQVTERAVRFVLDFPEAVQCVDQDALNAVMINKWFCIPGRFNVLFQDVPVNLPRKEYSNFLQDKVIIHYSLGTQKPWKSLCQNKFRYLYHQYLKKSPRASEKKYSDFKLTPFVVYKFYKIRTRESLLNHPKSFSILKRIAAGLLFFTDL